MSAKPQQSPPGSKPPSAAPSKPPSAAPSKSPSAAPSKPPSAAPSKPPSAAPSKPPSAAPSKPPSATPSKQSSSRSKPPSATPSSNAQSQKASKPATATSSKPEGSSEPLSGDASEKEASIASSKRPTPAPSRLSQTVWDDPIPARSIPATPTQDELSQVEETDEAKEEGEDETEGEIEDKEADEKEDDDDDEVVQDDDMEWDGGGVYIAPTLHNDADDDDDDKGWAPRVQIEDRKGGCMCFPNTTSNNVPSMVYDKITCKHLNVTGYTHKKVFKFYANWVSPGSLPPIHLPEFVAGVRKGQKQSNDFIYMLGYPPSKYGYNVPGPKVAAPVGDNLESVNQPQEVGAGGSRGAVSRATLLEDRESTRSRQASETESHSSNRSSKKPKISRESHSTAMQRYDDANRRRMEEESRARDLIMSRKTRQASKVYQTNKPPFLPPIPSQHSYLSDQQSSQRGLSRDDDMRAVEWGDKSSGDESDPVDTSEGGSPASPPLLVNDAFIKGRFNGRKFRGKMFDPAQQKTMHYAIQPGQDQWQFQKKYA